MRADEVSGVIKQTKHNEHHTNSTATVRDIVIGMSDGLTVPFALAAGLAGAVHSGRIVVVAGLAEIAAGSIAMGLGGYLAARGDEQHFHSERRREEREIVEQPEDEAAEIYEVFAAYGVSKADTEPVLRSLRANPAAYVDFMMRYELGLEEPLRGRAWRSALTIAASYVIGGFIPLLPYMLLENAFLALRASIVVTLLALAAFGWLKGRVLGLHPIRDALQTVLIGGAAAAAAFALARLLNHHG